MPVTSCILLFQVTEGESAALGLTVVAEWTGHHACDILHLIVAGD